jgi:hypothetical protein
MRELFTSHSQFVKPGYLMFHVNYNQIKKQKNITVKEKGNQKKGC